MNTAIERYLCVTATLYDRSNLRQLIESAGFEQVHSFIRDWETYPEKAPDRTRRDLRVFETQSLPISFVRPANLMDLVAFVKMFPQFPAFGELAGFDPYLERMGKETGIPLTIPCVSTKSGILEIRLLNNRKRKEYPYTLLVTDEIKL